MRDTELCLRPATELAALVRAREVSAAELLAAGHTVKPPHRGGISSMITMAARSDAT